MSSGQTHLVDGIAIEHIGKRFHKEGKVGQEGGEANWHNDAKFAQQIASMGTMCGAQKPVQSGQHLGKERKELTIKLIVCASANGSKEGT